MKTEKKNQLNQSIKNFLTQKENLEEKSKIVNKIDRKVINKKLLNLIEVLQRKTNALYISLSLKKISLKDDVEAQKIEISISKNFNR